MAEIDWELAYKIANSWVNGLRQECLYRFDEDGETVLTAIICSALAWKMTRLGADDVSEVLHGIFRVHGITDWRLIRTN